MSWPYVAASWRVPLPHVSKHLLNALADQCDPKGFVSASVQTLSSMTGMSDRTVQRAMQSLVKKGLAELVQHGTPVACHRYRLHIPGDSDANRGCQGVATLSPSLIPGSSAAAATRSDHKPTEKHVTLFVAELMKANGTKYNYEGGDAELVQDVQDLLVQRDFAAEAVRTQLPGWVSSALVRVRMARRKIR